MEKQLFLVACPYAIEAGVPCSSSVVKWVADFLWDDSVNSIRCSLIKVWLPGLVKDSSRSFLKGEWSSNSTGLPLLPHVDGGEPLSEDSQLSYVHILCYALFTCGWEPDYFPHGEQPKSLVFIPTFPPLTFRLPLQKEYHRRAESVQCHRLL